MVHHFKKRFNSLKFENGARLSEEWWRFPVPFLCDPGTFFVTRLLEKVTVTFKSNSVTFKCLRHHNIKCLDTIPLYKNLTCLTFWALGDEKPHFKFAKYCLKSCRKTLGSHFYPFSSIKNLLLKKSVFFFLLPILIHIMNHLKWIF